MTINNYENMSNEELIRIAASCYAGGVHEEILSRLETALGEIEYLRDEVKLYKPAFLQRQAD